MAVDDRPLGGPESVPETALERAYWYLAGQRKHLPCRPRSACGQCIQSLDLMQAIWEELWPWDTADEVEREARLLVEFFYLQGALGLDIHVPGPLFDVSLVP